MPLPPATFRMFATPTFLSSTPAFQDTPNTNQTSLSPAQDVPTFPGEQQAPETPQEQTESTADPLTATPVGTPTSSCICSSAQRPIFKHVKGVFRGNVPHRASFFMNPVSPF